MPLTRAQRAQRWGAIADDALARFEQCTVGPTWRAFVYSHALLAVGRRAGWDDPRIPGLLQNIMAARNPDGGWGIGVAWDAFGDGTANPANTTYTVTLAGHVGPALLEAWENGVAMEAEPLQTITKLLVSGTARNTSSAGTCVAYSRAASDASYCVHNVNAGVAGYLTRANAAGFGRTGLQSLVVDITRYEVTKYRTDWDGWPYSDGGGAVQDRDHGAYNASSLYFLAYPVGREGVYAVLNAPSTNDKDRRGHLQLVATPGGPGSQGVLDPTTTLWAEMGDRWLAEAASYVASMNGQPNELSQAAAWAAANAAACA